MLQENATAVVDDPGLPYLVQLTLGAFAGRVGVEKLEIRSREGAGPVTSEALRRVPLQSYVDAVLADPSVRTYVVAETQRTERSVGWGPPAKEQLEALRLAGRRRSDPADVLPAVVEAYRRALGDPRWRGKPTEKVAQELNYSRGHASRLLSLARKRGMLGDARPGVGGERPMPAPEANRTTKSAKKGTRK